jgi:aminopeptidase N
MVVAEITRAETQARAEMLNVHGYEIELDVTGGEDAFRSAVTVRFSCAAPGSATYADLLAAGPEAIESIVLNGRALDPAAHFADGRISLPDLAADNTLTVVASLVYSTPGFHRSTDPADGRVYTYTKFEPDHARRVYACFEQPDLKAPFTISVVAPADWTVISTQPTPEPAPLGDGNARWDFPPTPRLPTYLMHVTAGEYHVIRSTHTTPRGQTLPLALACRRSAAATLEAEAAELLEITTAGLDHFTALFDLDFPFEKYDQQFVPHYPAGATEHPAAVTFDEGFLPRSRPTAAEYEHRAVVILHEMAHQYFGDLTTMRWWDDLWLNESFAEWAGFHAAASATRYTGAWTGFAAGRKSWGYSTDLAPSTHPIAASGVATLSEAMANFDGISYAKGAAVLRQLITHLGEEVFVKGLRSYFAEHAWGNTTLADFLRHLETASGRNLGPWADAWLRTARPNTLAARFTLAEDGTFASFAVEQEAEAAHPTLRPHHIAIGLYEHTDGVLRRVHRVELDVDGPLTPVPELAGRRQPDLVLLNDDDLGYTLIRFDERSLATLLSSIGEFEDSLARSVCLTAAEMLTDKGELPVPEFVRLVAAAIQGETNVGVVQSLRRTVRQKLAFLADPAWSEHGRELLAQAASGLLERAEPGSDLQLAAVQLLAANAVDKEQLALVEGLYQGTKSLPGLARTQELRWSLLARLAATGRADDAAIDAEFARDGSDQGRRSAAAARASIQDPAHKEEAWALLTAQEPPAPMTLAEVGLAFRYTTDPALLAAFRDRYFEVLPAVWENRKSFSKQASAQLLFPLAVVDDALFELVDEFLLRHKDADPALVRSITELRDLAQRTAASRALGRRATTAD